MKKSEILQEMKQARHNFNRQKAREDLQLPTRISSTFWLSVYFDYKRQLEKPNKNRKVVRRLRVS